MMKPHFDSVQQNIIEISEGRHLVLAPPGCGKTAILAERVAVALGKGTEPSDMLCLTFTNRASRGMQSRILAHAGSRGSEVFVGNTHRFCGRYLFDNNVVGMSTGILDENDSMSIVLELAKSVEQPSQLTYSQRQRVTGALNLQHIMHQFRHRHPGSVLMNHDANLIELMRQLCAEMKRDATRSVIVDIYDNLDEIPAEIVASPFYSGIIDKLRLAKEYERYKHSNGMIDFDDMLLLTYDSLRRDGSHKRYRWIQIDEVQDLNPMQLAIVGMLECSDGVTLYLGDEQQSIFSFIGARQATVSYLRKLCGDNLHILEKNYRSPFYLLDVYNEYAIRNFGTDKSLLPQPNNRRQMSDGDLTILYSSDNEKCASDAAAVAKCFPENETTAIIVPTNRDADAVSDCLAGVSHFKISGADFFATDAMQFIISHLSVVACEHNYLAWTKIICLSGMTRRPDIARKTVMRMQSAAILPSDFLLYDDGSYITRFIDAYNTGGVVIFDTETTGLDVFKDDVVQIAALKITGGKIVDTFNIILETEKEIPDMLGDVVNPLVECYRKSEKAHRREGLMKFLDFSKDCVLIGHNIEYDYHILEQNLKHIGFVESLDDLFPRRFDTLKLARTVYPRLFSYKLKDLLVALSLEGENSHLADDDIIATKSLADALIATVTEHSFINRHLSTLEAASKFREKFRDLYGDLYSGTISRLYADGCHNAMVDEIKIVENWLIGTGILSMPMPKLKYVIRYLKTQITDDSMSLFGQLQDVLVDFATYREADLCEDSIVDEHIFVTTVHKAKGLEFDNVVVFGPVDGVYPFFKSETAEERREDARKLYVAMTRARRRLCLMPYDYYITPTAYGVKRFSKELSPFLKNVSSMFVQRHKKSNEFKNDETGQYV